MRVLQITALVCLAWPVFPSAGLQAFATQELTFPAGRIVEGVVSDRDSSQTFSLYVPTSYAPDRSWPIVVLMDPRGNSLHPLRKLVPAAEDLGYIVASSNNTASDVDGDPNTPAVNAILGSLMPLLSIDDRRIYLFGMSGTARIAWALGYAAIPHIAGVAGFGAGPPPDMDLEAAQSQYGAPFVFYGGAGDQDFNHAELVLLEGRLRRLGFRYTTSFYTDRHGWPTADSEFEAALSWLHLMAMKRQLIPVDADWVAREYEFRLAEARGFDEATALPMAWRSFSALGADFGGLVNTDVASDRARALSATAEVKEWRSRRLALARAHLAYNSAAGAWLRSAQTSDPDLDTALRALAVDSLKMAADDTTDPEGAAAAIRALTDLYSLTSFYFTRYHMAQEDWVRARLVLEVANEILPGTQRVCRQLELVSEELGERPSAGC